MKIPVYGLFALELSSHKYIPWFNITVFSHFLLLILRSIKVCTINHFSYPFVTFIACSVSLIFSSYTSFFHSWCCKNIDASVDNIAMLIDIFARSSAVQRSLSLAVIIPVSLLLRVDFYLFTSFVISFYFSLFGTPLSAVTSYLLIILILLLLCCWCYPFFFLTNSLYC